MAMRVEKVDAVLDELSGIVVVDFARTGQGSKNGTGTLVHGGFHWDQGSNVWVSSWGLLHC